MEACLQIAELYFALSSPQVEDRRNFNVIGKFALDQNRVASRYSQVSKT